MKITPGLQARLVVVAAIREADVARRRRQRERCRRRRRGVRRRSASRRAIQPPAPAARPRRPRRRRGSGCRSIRARAPGGRAITHTRRSPSVEKAALEGAARPRPRARRAIRATSSPGGIVGRLVVARGCRPRCWRRRRSCARSRRCPAAGRRATPPSATLPNSATAPVAASASERSVVASQRGQRHRQERQPLPALASARAARSTPASASGTASTRREREHPARRCDSEDAQREQRAREQPARRRRRAPGQLGAAPERVAGRRRLAKYDGVQRAAAAQVEQRHAPRPGRSRAPRRRAPAAAARVADHGARAERERLGEVGRRLVEDGPTDSA